jgi:hypothetical protein
MAWDRSIVFKDQLEVMWKEWVGVRFFLDFQIMSSMSGRADGTKKLKKVCQNKRSSGDGDGYGTANTKEEF